MSRLVTNNKQWIVKCFCFHYCCRKHGAVSVLPGVWEGRSALTAYSFGGGDCCTLQPSEVCQARVSALLICSNRLHVCGRLLNLAYERSSIFPHRASHRFQNSSAYSCLEWAAELFQTWQKKNLLLDGWSAFGLSPSVEAELNQTELVSTQNMTESVSVTSTYQIWRQQNGDREDSTFISSTVCVFDVWNIASFRRIVCGTHITLSWEGAM